MAMIGTSSSQYEGLSQEGNVTVFNPVVDSPGLSVVAEEPYSDDDGGEIGDWGGLEDEESQPHRSYFDVLKNPSYEIYGLLDDIHKTNPTLANEWSSVVEKQLSKFIADLKETRRLEVEKTNIRRGKPLRDSTSSSMTHNIMAPR